MYGFEVLAVAYLRQMPVQHAESAVTGIDPLGALLNIGYPDVVMGFDSCPECTNALREVYDSFTVPAYQDRELI